MAFWQDKTLSEMTQQEWESLCDGCGRCCLHKLEDEDSGEIISTNIACHLLDTQSCRCTHYSNRTNIINECLDIRALPTEHYHWLPESCAYRARHEGRELAHWHPLVSGSTATVVTSGISIQGRCISASDTLKTHT